MTFPEKDRNNVVTEGEKAKRCTSLGPVDAQRTSASDTEQIAQAFDPIHMQIIAQRTLTVPNKALGEFFLVPRHTRSAGRGQSSGSLPFCCNLGIDLTG